MSDHLAEIESLLDTFDRLADGPDRCPWTFSHRGGEFPFHVVIGAIVHGNEIGTLPSVVDLARRLARGEIEFGGDLTVVLGNPDAALEGRRFLDTDLNRSFGTGRSGSREERRAAEMEPILSSADLFFDLHQTTEATDRPFYIGPFGDDLWRWASALGGASTWVTRPPGVGFSAAGMCADEFVRDLGRPGLTLEVGRAGMHPESDTCTQHVLEGLLAVASEVGRSGLTLPDKPDLDSDLSFVTMSWAQPFDDPRLRLREGITNFMPVSAGERLSASSSPSIIAPSDGLLLFPKYLDYDADGVIVSPPPGEIIRIVEPLPDHPSRMWR